MKEQIAEYLAQGYKPEAVATMCGCSPQYISEIFKEDAGFKELLREKMREHTAVRIDNNYTKLEENTLKEINAIVTDNTLDINDLCRVLESVAKIKNANKSIQMPAHYNNPTLGLTLVFPQQAVPQVVVDDSNRITAIGDKTMLPMPAKAVRDLFKGRMALEEPVEPTLTLTKLAQG